MKSTPLLFKPEMIRACLDGRKRMTRRLVKPQPAPDATFMLERFPYGKVGDEIWAKETWRPSISHHCAEDACDCGDVIVRYAADGEVKLFPDSDAMGDWSMPKVARTGNVSPLFMPRWASRFVRTLTRVRVERLQSITEADAITEGVLPLSSISPTQRIAGDSRTQATHPHCVAFAVLWDHINGARAPWSSNPWVWVLEW